MRSSNISIKKETSNDQQQPNTSSSKICKFCKCFTRKQNKKKNYLQNEENQKLNGATTSRTTISKQNGNNKLIKQKGCEKMGLKQKQRVEKKFKNNNEQMKIKQNIQNKEIKKQRLKEEQRNREKQKQKQRLKEEQRNREKQKQKQRLKEKQKSMQFQITQKILQAQKLINKILAGFDEGRCHVKSFSKQNITNFKEFYQQYVKIQQFNIDSIEQLISKMDLNNLNNFITEMLIVDSALLQSFQKRLTTHQILSVYILLFDQNAKKLLLQLLTAQGNSNVIACTAAILAMRGDYVDIVSSSQIIAKKESQLYQGFYSLIGLKSNSIQSLKQNEIQITGKRCNSQQIKILYGSFSQFKVRNKTKCNNKQNKFGVAIVDDFHLLVNEKKLLNAILHKVFNFSAWSDYLRPLQVIWQTILRYNIVKDENGKMYILMYGKQQNQIIKIDIQLAVELKIATLEKLLNFQETDQKMSPSHISKDDLNGLNNPLTQIQDHYFIKCSLSKWIESALIAFRMIAGTDYQFFAPFIFNNDSAIKLQQHTHWNYGLYQFLHMKHGLSVLMRPIDSSIFASIHHFTQYQRIYGLITQFGINIQNKYRNKLMQFLNKSYNVQIISFGESIDKKQRQIIQKRQEWIQKIRLSCENKLTTNRSIVIFCQTLVQALNIKDHIQKNSAQKNNTHIKVLITGLKNYNAIIGCKQIIIVATSDASQMYLQSSQELIKEGGMHVIVTFKTDDSRTQKKFEEIGRRSGAPGSYEHIVLNQFFLICDKENIEQKVDRIPTRQVKYKQMIRCIDVLKQKNMLGQICQIAFQIEENQKDMDFQCYDLRQEWRIFIKKCLIIELKEEKISLLANQLKQKIQIVKAYQNSKIHDLKTCFVNSNDQSFQQSIQKLVQKIQLHNFPLCHKKRSNLSSIGSMICKAAIMRLRKDENFQKYIQQIKKKLIKRRNMQRGLHILRCGINYNNAFPFLQKQQIKRQQRGIIYSIKNFLSKQIYIQKWQGINIFVQKLLNDSQDIIFNTLIQYLDECKNLQKSNKAQITLQIPLEDTQNLYLFAINQILDFKYQFKQISRSIPYVPSLRNGQKINQLKSNRREKLKNLSIQSDYLYNTIKIYAGILLTSALKGGYKYSAQEIFLILCQYRKSIVQYNQKFSEGKLKNNFVNFQSIKCAFQIANINFLPMELQAFKKEGKIIFLKMSMVQFFNQTNKINCPNFLINQNNLIKKSRFLQKYRRTVNDNSNMANQKKIEQLLSSIFSKFLYQIYPLFDQIIHNNIVNHITEIQICEIGKQKLKLLIQKCLNEIPVLIIYKDQNQTRQILNKQYKTQLLNLFKKLIDYFKIGQLVNQVIKFIAQTPKYKQIISQNNIIRKNKEKKRNKTCLYSCRQVFQQAILCYLQDKFIFYMIQKYLQRLQQKQRFSGPKQSLCSVKNDIQNFLVNGI